MELARGSPVAMGTHNNQSGAFYLSDFRSVISMESLNELYSSICSDLQLSPNKYISQELKDTEKCIRFVHHTRFSLVITGDMKVGWSSDRFPPSEMCLSD